MWRVFTKEEKRAFSVGLATIYEYNDRIDTYLISEEDLIKLGDFVTIEEGNKIDKFMVTRTRLCCEEENWIRKNNAFSTLILSLGEKKMKIDWNKDIRRQLYLFGKKMAKNADEWLKERGFC